MRRSRFPLSADRSPSEASTARRTLAVVAVAAILAVPAVVLRVLCVGPACDRSAPADAPVPFCSLPGDVRAAIASGFRDGRSPEVLAVTGPVSVGGSTGLRPQGGEPPWPRADERTSPPVPIALAGAGIRASAEVPAGTGLQDVAPTVAEIIGLERPHPRVRSGQAVPGVATAERPRLVLQVVWKGVDTADLRSAPRAWPALRSVLRRGAGTLAGDPGSLPLDPAAQLATLGTGGVPSEHGITGTLLRNDQAELVRAWDEGAPFSVIAALGDDLDRRTGQRSRIGLVGADVADRGAIGGNWYVERDRDDVVLSTGDVGQQVEEARRLLAGGYGDDEVPDLLVVVMADSVRRMDRALRSLVAAAEDASGGSATTVVTSTGGSPPAGEHVSDQRVTLRLERALGADVVEATAVGGLFLDQRAMARGEATQDQVLGALRRLSGPRGKPLIADAFSGVAVSLERYC